MEMTRLEVVIELEVKNWRCKRLGHFEAKAMEFSKKFWAPDAGKMFLHRTKVTVEICGRSSGSGLHHCAIYQATGSFNGHGTRTRYVARRFLWLGRGPSPPAAETNYLPPAPAYLHLHHKVHPLLFTRKAGLGYFGCTGSRESVVWT